MIERLLRDHPATSATWIMCRALWPIRLTSVTSTLPASFSSFTPSAHHETLTPWKLWLLRSLPDWKQSPQTGQAEAEPSHAEQLCHHPPEGVCKVWEWVVELLLAQGQLWRRIMTETVSLYERYQIFFLSEIESSDKNWNFFSRLFFFSKANNRQNKLEINIITLPWRKKREPLFSFWILSEKKFCKNFSNSYLLRQTPII